MLTLIQGSGGSVSCALRTIQGGGVRVCVCLWTHIDESLPHTPPPLLDLSWEHPGNTHLMQKCVCWEPSSCPPPA